MAAAPAQATAEVLPVAFTNAQGHRLAGLLTLSSSPTKRCVILCHGYASHKQGFQLPVLAAALADAGFNSLRFDFCGNGESEGPFRLANYTGEAADVAAAKLWLETQHGQEVVALLGHSKGGDVVVLYAARYDDIPLVVNVAGRYDLRDGIASRFGTDVFSRVLQGPVSLPAQRDDGVTFTWSLTKEDLDERLATDVPAAAAAVKRSKVLTIHGTADTVIPVTDARKFAAALPGGRLVEVEGADHNFRSGQQHVQQLVDAVLAFLRAHEGPPIS